MDSEKITFESVDDLTNNLILKELQSLDDNVKQNDFNKDDLLWLRFVNNSNVKSSIEKFFRDSSAFEDLRNRRIVLLSAISSLQLFVIDNYLGRFNEEYFEELGEFIKFLDKILPGDSLTNVTKMVPMFNNGK